MGIFFLLFGKTRDSGTFTVGLSIFPAPMTREDMDIDWKIFVRLNMHPFTHIFSPFFLPFSYLLFHSLV